MDKQKSLELLQQVKCYLQNLAVDAGQPTSVIQMYLGFIDKVQLYIDPNVDLNNIQDSISSK